MSKQHSEAMAKLFDEYGCPILSAAWTPEERLAAASFLVSVIGDDARLGRYSAIGRPNSVSVQYVCALPAEELEAHGVRAEIERFASERR